MERGKFTEEQIKEALKTDPEAITFRMRIAKTKQMLDTTYAERITAEYMDYIQEKYRT